MDNEVDRHRGEREKIPRRGLWLGEYATHYPINLHIRRTTTGGENYIERSHRSLRERGRTKARNKSPEPEIARVARIGDSKGLKNSIPNIIPRGNLFPALRVPLQDEESGSRDKVEGGIKTKIRPRDQSSGLDWEKKHIPPLTGSNEKGSSKMPKKKRAR